VVVNGAEGEPGAAKDKTLLARAPHLVLDGAALCAKALNAQEIVIGVEDDAAERSVRAAAAERKMPAPVRVITLTPRFLSGEGGALVRAINGDVPIPPGRKVRAAQSGVSGLPTLLSNAETYAQLAVLASLGPDLYSSIGTPKEAGTVLLTIGGQTVVETATGTPLAAAFEAAGAEPGQAVLVGGYHGNWITPQAAMQCEVSRAGFAAVGGALGAGIVLPLAAGTCPLAEVVRIAAYLANESAGQCGPCRMGLPEVVRTLNDLVDGNGTIGAVRRAAGLGRGRGACSHPDGTARFVLTAMDVFARDIQTHRDHGTCGRPLLELLPLPSSRGTQRLSVDWARCDGHGVCAYIVPELVHLDRNGFPVILNSPMPPWVEKDAKMAIAMCPALALRFTGEQRRAPTPVSLGDDLSERPKKGARTR